MYRVYLKDGRCFFAEKMEQAGDIMYYKGVSVAYAVSVLDDAEKYSDGNAPIIRKSVRIPAQDIVSPTLNLKSVDFYDSHYIPLFEPDFTGLAAEINKEDAAHEKYLSSEKSEKTA